MSKLAHIYNPTGKLTVTMPQDLIDKMKRSVGNVSQYVALQVQRGLEESRAERLKQKLRSIKRVKCEKTAVELTRECRDEEP